jgi:hypothetical protein
MRKITMPVEKTAIQELSGDQLDMLVKFGKSKEFGLLNELAEEEKYKRYKRDFLTAQNAEDIALQRGISIGIDYIMDSVERAKEEIKARGADIDNEEDLK